MEDAPFFVAFFLILLLLAASTGSDGLFGSAVSTTTSSAPVHNQVQNTNTTISESQPVKPAPDPLTDEQLERKVIRLYSELDDLNEELRELEIRKPVSPYTKQIDLRIGNARSTDPGREYLILEAERKNSESIEVSDWYVESYVTEKRVALSEGIRVPPKRTSSKTEPIFLEPGERAYILTQESPVDFSFHENLCTGYLANYSDFNPSLKRSCPDPEKEMLRFANIKLDDDSCYDFVERVRQCEVVDEDNLEEADLSKACTYFIENNLNYTDCVKNHRNELFFDDVGYWRIYLDRDEDIWRKEREIIRLMDENDQVIDVIEY